MTALENLYNGNINPCCKTIKKGSEYDKLSKSLLEKEEHLIKDFNNDQKKLYESIFEDRFDQEDIYLKETFIEGFRLGAQIMLEVLTEPDKQLIDISK